jgi:RNA polymerase sigma factor (sigma-70 family)
MDHSAAATGDRDVELVLAARRGDKRAFVEIVSRHQAMVCGIALSILGDFAASEDAAQEAFLTAWRKFAELREPERLRGWLAQIARNSALGHLRRSRPEEPLEHLEGAPDLAIDLPGPDEAAARSEEAALVRETLSKLPEEYRLPLILFYREGHSTRAVAEALGISEDAARQRMSRGREMIREQLAGTVESVLRRTAPTAVFTILIASAIGALAAPAAVAAGVFAAASSAAAGTASAAGSSSPSLLALMSTSKAFVITAVVVATASIPIGYHLRSDAPSAQPRATEQQREVAAAPVTGTPMNFEDSALFAEWRKLHETYGSDSAAMPALHKAISEMKDQLRRRAFTAALIAEWVQLDPSAGFNFFSAKGRDGNQRKQFFQEWLAADAKSAVDSLVKGGEPWGETAKESLADIARKLPGRVADVVPMLPAPDNDYWDSSVRDAFAIVAEAGLEEARAAAEKISGPYRQQALEGVGRAWAKSDFNAALAWARSMPEGVDGNEIIRNELLGLASFDPAAALNQVGLVPSGGRQMYFASTTGARVLSEAATTDFDATLGWIVAHPGKLTSEDLLGIAKEVTDRLNADAKGFLDARASDGSLEGVVPAIGSALLNQASKERGAVWDWLRTQPDNEATKALRGDVLNSAAWQDPATALKLAADLPPTKEGDEEINSLARGLLNGGSMMYRFDSLYSQAPDRLKQPLLQSAFGNLRADNLDDPQTWVTRLPQVPDSDRGQAEQSLARAWAEKSPENAIAWTQTLPADSARASAFSAIASTWAATDSSSATSWVQSMPQGTERDQSANALSTVLAERNPKEAWDIALSIGNETQRQNAAAHVITTLAVRDIGTARQWIDASPFPADAKAQLQASLSQPGARARR